MIAKRASILAALAVSASALMLGSTYVFMHSSFEPITQTWVDWLLALGWFTGVYGTLMKYWG